MGTRHPTGGDLVAGEGALPGVHGTLVSACSGLSPCAGQGAVAVGQEVAGQFRLSVREERQAKDLSVPKDVPAIAKPRECLGRHADPVVVTGGGDQGLEQTVAERDLGCRVTVDDHVARRPYVGPRGLVHCEQVGVTGRLCQLGKRGEDRCVRVTRRIDRDELFERRALSRRERQPGDLRWAVVAVHVLYPVAARTGYGEPRRHAQLGGRVAGARVEPGRPLGLTLIDPFPVHYAHVVGTAVDAGLHLDRAGLLHGKDGETDSQQVLIGEAGKAFER